MTACLSCIGHKRLQIQSVGRRSGYKRQAVLPISNYLETTNNNGADRNEFADGPKRTQPPEPKFHTQLYKDHRRQRPVLRAQGPALATKPVAAVATAAHDPGHNQRVLEGFIGGRIRPQELCEVEGGSLHHPDHRRPAPSAPI